MIVMGKPLMEAHQKLAGPELVWVHYIQQLQGCHGVGLWSNNYADNSQID